LDTLRSRFAQLLRDVRLAPPSGLVRQLMLCKEGDLGVLDAERIGREVDAALVAFLRI
jgi:hypothetical protein